MASMSVTVLSNATQLPKCVVSGHHCSAGFSSLSASGGHAACNLTQPQKIVFSRFMYVSSPDEELKLRSFTGPLCAVGKGLEASIAGDDIESDIKVKNAMISMRSQEEEKIQLRVDVPGQDTDKVFNLVLRNLAASAPPIPGFRRQKGGKTTKVPRDFLLSVLGEERVTKFVIQEIVSSTVANYVKKENLVVKENKLNTTQTIEELLKSFSPGKDFGFDANLELEKSETDETAADQDSNIIDVTVSAEV